MIGKLRFPLALVVAVALSLSACGRRGDVEPAPDPSALRNPASSNDQIQVHKSIPKIEPPKKPFILDPLL